MHTVYVAQYYLSTRRQGCKNSSNGMHLAVISVATCTCITAVYSGPPLIRTLLLPNNSVLIKEVSFGEREHYIHLQYLLPEVCVLYRGASSLESVL